MTDLNDLRKQIDEIDAELLPLFTKRMECSRKVAEYKIANNMPVFDPSREEQILNNKADLVSDELKTSVREFYSSIMKISKAMQTKIIGAGRKADLLDSFENGPMVTNPTVAYQGIPGANSETALIKFFGEDTKKINVMTFGEVLDAVESGDADYGVLPLENSSTGSISGAYDLLERRDMYIIGEVNVDICHCLVALPTAELRDIRKVYSHEQGYMQCKKFFDNYPKMTFHPYHNTAMAAKMISGLGDVSCAAVADIRTAELYGLQVLADNISSIGTNITKFVVVAKKGHLDKDNNKISVMFTLPHQSGALCKALSIFSDNGLNLLKILSRPSHDENFEYIFFVDFEGNLLDDAVKNAISQLDSFTESLKILGSYKGV